MVSFCKQKKKKNPWAVEFPRPKSLELLQIRRKGMCLESYWPPLEKGFTLAKPALHAFGIYILLPSPDC